MPIWIPSDSIAIQLDSTLN